MQQSFSLIFLGLCAWKEVQEVGSYNNWRINDYG